MRQRSFSVTPGLAKRCAVASTPRTLSTAVALRCTSVSTPVRRIAWSTSRGAPYIATPIVYRDYLYVCRHNGVLACYRAKTGELIYEQRLGSGGFFSSSPIAGDGKIYAISEEGEVYVVKAGPTFEVLSTNAMGEVCMATPAIARGMIIMRTQSHLLGIGTK